jgi:hypothetical protein
MSVTNCGRGENGISGGVNVRVTMVEIAFPGSEWLKGAVWERLMADGTLKRMNKNIKIALTSAIGEMRGTTDTDSVLDNRFRPKHSVELSALQTIYQYLAEHDLTWSLQCLIDETQVRKDPDAFDLIQVMDPGEPDMDDESLEEEHEEEDDE